MAHSRAVRVIALIVAMYLTFYRSCCICCLVTTSEILTSVTMHQTSHGTLWHPDLTHLTAPPSSTLTSLPYPPPPPTAQYHRKRCKFRFQIFFLNSNLFVLKDFQIRTIVSHPQTNCIMSTISTKLVHQCTCLCSGYIPPPPPPVDFSTAHFLPFTDQLSTPPSLPHPPPPSPVS